jgi:maltokinase
VIVPLVELSGAEREVREASALDAAAYAEVTAALHVALAETLGVRQATTADLVSRAANARQLLHDAMASVPAEARPGLEAALPELEKAIAGLETATGAPLARVHGDLHVGQFLRSGRGLVVVDFEGEPGRSLAERRRPWTPLRDLASLLLSLDHAAAAAARRVRETGGDAGYLSVWADAARAAALDAYERGIAGSGLAVDGRLLRACEAEKESAELLYAARTLPEWLYAPLEVLARRFGGGA